METRSPDCRSDVENAPVGGRSRFVWGAPRRSPASSARRPRPAGRSHYVVMSRDGRKLVTAADRQTDTQTRVTTIHFASSTTHAKCNNSLRHRLRTLTTVPKLTQPSALIGTVKLVSAFVLSNNNKRRWRMRMVAAFTSAFIFQVGWLGLRYGDHLALSLHSSNEPGELSQWPRHDYSYINIVTGISLFVT